MELSNTSAKQFALLLAVFVAGGLLTTGSLLVSGYVIHEDNSGYTIRDNPEMAIIYELERYENVPERVFNSDVIEGIYPDRMDDQVIKVKNCGTGNQMCNPAVENKTVVFEHIYTLENAESFNGLVNFKGFNVNVPDEYGMYIDKKNSFIEIMGMNEDGQPTKFKWFFDDSEKSSIGYADAYYFDASLMPYSKLYVSNDVLEPNWVEGTMIVTEKGIDVLFKLHIEYFNTEGGIHAIRENPDLEIETKFIFYNLEPFGSYTTTSDRFRIVLDEVD